MKIIRLIVTLPCLIICTCNNTKKYDSILTMKPNIIEPLPEPIRKAGFESVAKKIFSVKVKPTAKKKSSERLEKSDDSSETKR